MNIAELLAKKSAKPAAPTQPEAAASPAKKSPFPGGIKIREEAEALTPAAEPAIFIHRSLSTTSGEDLTVLRDNAPPEEVVWHSALQGLDTELCIIPDSDPRSERAWIAIRRKEKPEQPLYLYSLPFFLNPRPNQDGQPF